MALHFRLSAAARTVSLGQVLRMVDAEAETTFAPAIWWRLLHKSDNLAQMPLGVQPAQGMLEDVELAGLVGDNPRVGEQAAPDDRADHGRLRAQPALTRVQAVQMSLPRGLVGKAS